MLLWDTDLADLNIGAEFRCRNVRLSSLDWLLQDYQDTPIACSSVSIYLLDMSVHSSQMS